ncbi:MAG: cytochrome c oxidase assembly protein [Actinomycetota bacterium]|nr:cytochrome c oxidase assembly protein [Actinomycetota bacterium]
MSATSQSPSASPDSTRVPRLAVLSWSVAGAVFVALGVAVWHYLHRVGPSTPSGMAGMHDDANALARAGSGTLRPLFGAALIRAWQLDAVALALLVLVGTWYLTGAALVPIRHPGARWPIGRTTLFMFGLGVCAFATNGSIAVYDQVLFTAHMTGHLALVMLAPALLVGGRPLTLALAATTQPRREHLERIVRGRVISTLTAPPVALASYTAVIVGTHLTGLMDTIMRNTWAGQLEHLIYVLVGCQFFALIIGDEPLRWRLASPARWLLLAVAMAVDTFTGVVLLQGTHAVAMLTSPELHVEPLSDTRTGGAIMWFGGDGIMAAVMIVLVINWLRQAGDRAGDEPGWLEQARRATFAGNTGAEVANSTTETFDDDDDARASYNEWLAQLDRRG